MPTLEEIMNDPSLSRAEKMRLKNELLKQQFISNNNNSPKSSGEWGSVNSDPTKYDASLMDELMSQALGGRYRLPQDADPNKWEVFQYNHYREVPGSRRTYNMPGPPDPMKMLRNPTAGYWNPEQWLSDEDLKKWRDQQVADMRSRFGR